MGNPNPTANERTMAQLIVSILNSAPALRIDYNLNGVAINPGLYSFICLSIVSPASTTKNIGVKVLAMPAGTEAQYDIPTNNLQVPSSTYGGTPFQKMTLVHESTHAALDARGSANATPRLLNETIAYISGGLFNVYSAPSVAGPFPFVPTGGIYLEAHRLAIKMRRNQDQYPGDWAYALYQSDVTALQNAIKASPTYTNFFTNPTATYGDDGVSH